MNELGFRSKKVLGFGEIMLRLTPPNNQKIIQANSFEAVYSGGEANVIASLAILGHDTKFVTKLPDNYLGKKVISKFITLKLDMVLEVLNLYMIENILQYLWPQRMNLI